MQILKHRANSISNIPQNFGVEIDVRDFDGTIVLSHDHPTYDDPKLINYLKCIKKETLIAINIKSSEIEIDLKEILKTTDIKNYFTFDWSVPSLLKAIKNELICAFRLSEFEKEIFTKCTWVWVDSFYSIWYDEKFLESLKNMNLRIAVVSPELHNRNNDLVKIKQISTTGLIDAICTDIPDYWLK